MEFDPLSNQDSTSANVHFEENNSTPKGAEAPVSSEGGSNRDSLNSDEFEKVEHEQLLEYGTNLEKGNLLDEESPSDSNFGSELVSNMPVTDSIVTESKHISPPISENNPEIPIIGERVIQSEKFIPNIIDEKLEDLLSSATNEDKTEKSSVNQSPPSPTIEFTPVRERSPSPMHRERTPSPPRDLTPRQRTPSPTWEPTPSKERTPSPTWEPTPPKERTPSPTWEPTPPKERTPSPPREPSPPPKQRTPSPPREPTPPPKQRTPSPPREPTPPPKQRTPSPPRESTPSPPREPAPTDRTPSLIKESPAKPNVISDFDHHKETLEQVVEEATKTIQKPLKTIQPSHKNSDSAILGSAWFQPDKLDPRVMNLIYWRDVKQSGIVFGSIMIVLMSLAYLSLISVIAYSSLAVLIGTLSFRIYKNIMQAIQKSQDGHPFKQYLEYDTNVSSEKAQEITEIAVSQFNCAIGELKRLFLVEDLVDSVKFCCLLWCLTYVGSWFNGLTLVILAVVSLFTLPKVYEQNQAVVDQYLGIVSTQYNEISNKIKAAIPIGGNKEKAQ